jgi:hypothetical protein
MKPRSNARSPFGLWKSRVRDTITGRKRLVLESLEDRLLLSTLAYNAVDSTPLTLLLAGNQLEVVQTANPSTVLASNKLNQTSAVQIGANGFNVSLTIDASVPTISPGGVQFDGGSGTATLIGPNTTNTWHITGTGSNAGSGDINGTGGVRFQHVTNLTGNSGADTFVFANGATLGGTIAGGGGTNTLDYSAYTSSSPVTVNLATSEATGTGGYSGIQSIIGGQGSDTLVGPASDTTWNIAGTSAENVAGMAFTSFENLTGGAGADTFVFSNSASITGSISGGGGANTLNYAAYTAPVTVKPTAGTATGTGGFSGVQRVVGGQGSDTIVGPATDTTWSITGTNAGNIAGVAFTSFENLTGGTGADTFVFASGASVSGNITGGGGADTLNYSAYTTPVNVNLGANTATGTGRISGITNLIGGAGSNTLVGPAADTTWNLTGTNSGAVAGVTFTSFQNLTGGAGADTFVFANPSTGVSGTISGGGATNTLSYSAYSSSSPVTVNLAANTAPGTGGFSGIQSVIGGQGSDTIDGPATNTTWNVTGMNAENVAGITFTSFENLTGGAGADTFVFSNGASIAGSISGGGGANTLSYAAYTTPVTVNPTAGTATGTGGFNGIQSVVGGQGSDTIVGPATDTTWNITGANAGNVVGMSFASFENLTGGAGADTFVFSDGAGVSGVIAGGGGANALSYAAYTAPVSVNLAASTATGTGGFSGIQSFIGGQGSDTLAGPAAGSTWNLFGANAGTVAGVTFTSLENLTGGAGADTFNFANGASESGNVTGGGGADTLNYSAYTTPVTVNLGAKTATGTGGASGFTNVIGGAGNDTLVGPTADSTWNLTGANSGNVAGVTFTSFENLTGAASNDDTFILFPGGQASGTIDGGAGGYDKLVFDDGSGNRVNFAPTGPQSGTVVSPAGTMFRYGGMEHNNFYLSDFSDPANVTIAGNPIAANSLSLAYFTANLVEVSQGAAGESIAFPIPANSLTINMGDVGSNTLTIGSATPLVLPGALTINGGFPTNRVVLAGALALGGGLAIDTAAGATTVSLNAALTVLSGGMTIDNHLGLAQTVQLNAPARIQGNVSILGSILADTVTLNASLDVLGGSLTIQSWVTAVDEQLGLDTVSLKSTVNTHGGDFRIDAATINVAPAATISTRDLAPNSSSTYVGDSGAIGFDGQTISVGAGASLLANSDAAGVYQPGDVTLSVTVFDPSGALPVDALPSTNPGITLLNGSEILGGQINLMAEKTSQTQLLAVSLLSLQSKTATITITDATIDGTGVAIQANAQDANGLTGTAYNVVSNLAISPATNLLPFGPPILSTVSVQERSATATVTVNGSTIHATTGDVTVDSTVNVNSNAPAGGGYNATVARPNPKNPLTVIPYSAGYGEAVGSSATLIGGASTLSSDSGNVAVTSEATTSAVVQAFTASNALFGGQNAPSRKTASGSTTLPSVAIGVTDTDTSAHAIVRQDVQISAGGNVDVNATGNVTNNAWAGTATFGDGTGSFGFTLGTDTTNVLSQVQGHIKAGGVANVLNVDLSKVNQTDNTITIPNHGLTTGEAIVYHAAAPPSPSDPLASPTPLAPIGGLTDGQTYYVIVKDPNTIQLAAAPSIDLDATGMDPSETNTLSTRAVQSVDASAIDVTTSTITLPDHGFSELQPVTAVTTSNWNIQGLEPQGDYYVHVVDANHIELLTQIAANAGPTPQLLPGTNYYIVPLTATIGSNGQPLTPTGTLLLGYNTSAVTFNPATAVQPDSSLYLPGNNFQTGDLVTYNVVQGTQTPVGVNRSALFSPGDFDVAIDPTTVANKTISMLEGTNLVTGQRVIYSAGGGGAPIGGLTDGDAYYVVVTPSDDIQLASSQSNALSGTTISLEPGTGTAQALKSDAVDSADNELVIPDSQLATGQQVVYEADDPADSVTGLTPGTTYYVIRVNDDLLGLASSRQDASAGKFIAISCGGAGSQQSLETNTFVSTIDTSQTTPVVDYAANTIELPGSGLVTGQIVQYDPGDSDPIGGLAAGPYSVIVVDPDHIQLALVATPNTPIDLVPLPLTSGIQQFTTGDQVFQFDPLTQPTVKNSSIWMEGNLFKTGDQVTYLTGGGEPIGGLSDGQTYVVIESVDGNSFQLANPSNPTTPITLTPPTTGSIQGFERASTGELGAPPIGGLQDGAQYYVTEIDADHIRLSASLQAAEAAAPIPLTLTAAQQADPNLMQYFTASDENPGINVLASLSAQNSQKTESQVGGAPTLSQILMAYIPPAPGAILKTILGKPTNATPSPFSGAGAIALNAYTHTVNALISRTAVLQSGTDVTVNASSQNYSQAIADGQVMTVKDGGKWVAVAVAVAYGSYDNTVLATVGSGAIIDSAGTLDVVSELTYPDLTQFLPFNPNSFDITSPSSGNWMQQLSNALNGRGGLDLLMNLWANVSSTTAGSPAFVSVTASYASATYTNDSEATIGSGAMINQNQGLQTPSQYVGVFADTTMSLLNLAGVIKLQLDATGLNAASKARSSPISPFGNQAGTLGIGGAILLQTIDDTTLAAIESGAIIHTGTGTGGGLGLGATENLVSVNLAQSGGASGVFGLSGAVSIVTHVASTVAKLQSGVQVYGGPVDIKSKSDLNYYNIAGAAQIAGAVGVGASAAVNYLTRDTEAYVGALALSFPPVPGNAATVIDATGLSAQAENTGNILGVSVAGAIVDPALANKASTGSTLGVTASRLPLSVGVAGAVGINEVTDTAESYINDNGSFDLGQGDLKLTSVNDTRVLAVTGSVSLAALDLLTAALAGAVSLNTLDATTESFVIGAQVASAGKVLLDAERQGQVMAVTIAASGSAASGQSTVTVSPATGGSGGSGGASGNGQASISVDVAASVSLNSLEGETLAFIQDAAVLGTGAVSLTANDSSMIDADGGGAAIVDDLTGGKKVGVAIAAGVSVAVNDETTTLASYLDNAQVGHGVDIGIAAENSSTINAVTVAGAAVFSDTSQVGLVFNGAGAGSGNNIQNTIQAYVLDCAGIQPQSLLLAATDDSQISATAVAVAMSVALTNASGVATAISMGGTATVNEIKNTVEAFIENSTISALGSATIEAVESSSIDALCVGAALAYATTANGVSLAGAGVGAVAINTISNVVSASIDENSVFHIDGLTVSALDVAAINASSDGGALAIGTGGVGAGIGLSLAASVAKNTISDDVLAAVDDSTVSSSGNLSLIATSQNGIDALVISIAVSAGIAGGDIPIGVAAAGAGADATNAIQNTINGRVTDGASVTADGTVTLSATDTSMVTASVAAAAAAGGTVAVAAGLSLTSNSINNQVAAFVDGSSVKSAGGGLTITAITTGNVGATSIGIATALAIIGVAAAGAQADSTVTSTVQAYANNATLSSSGGTQIVANSSLTAGALTAAASLGVAVGISVLIPSVTIGGSTLAYLEGASTVNASNLAVHATSNNQANLPLGLILAIGIAGGAGAGASATVTRDTEAYAGAETGGASTLINVPQGGVSIIATSTSSASSNVSGGAFGGINIAAFLDTATIGGATRAFVGPAATVSALSLTIHANADENAAADVLAIGAGLIGGTGASATASITSVTEAFAGADTTRTPSLPEVALDVTGAVDIVASSTGTTHATDQGGSGGGLEVTALLATANDDGQTHAFLSTGLNTAIHAGSLNVEADGFLSSVTQSFALGIALITVSDAIARSTVGSDTPGEQSVAAYIVLAPGLDPASSNAVMTSTGAITVTANETPHASAAATGVDAGAIAVDAVGSDANVIGTTQATLGDGITFSTPSLTVSAQRQNGSGPTAEASTTAGAGGLLGDVNAATSRASSSGTVQAAAGNVMLTGGDVTIQATNASDQSASSSGVAAGGLLAAGTDVATASSSVSTQATLGPQAMTVLTGTLLVSANGTDENDVSGESGSGALFAGDAAKGNTNDLSTTSASVGGSLLHAVTVSVSANNNSVFSSNVSSVNASLAGGSGASANNSDITAASAEVLPSTNIQAGMLVDITANNTYTENVPPNGNSVAAGGGGVINGNAADSSTNLTGNSSVTIDGNVTMDVETPAAAVAGASGIFLNASSGLTTADLVTLSTGGGIEGSGVDSSLHATLNNSVATSSSSTAPDIFTTNQDIGIGTDTQVNSNNTSESHTWGVLGAGASASATTDVTSNQAVNIGPFTTLTAAQNISLSAGDNPTPGAANSTTIMVGSSNGQSYARGLIGVPVAQATTTLTSNATLIVGANSQIQSGENTSLAADKGEAFPTAKGIGHGYELFFIPVTNGSSSTSTPSSSNVMINGTVTAGVFHTLSITIPNDQSAADANGDSQTVIVNGGPAKKVATSFPGTLLSGPTFMSFSAAFDPNFNPYSTIATAAANGEFPDAGEAAALEAAVYDGVVGAMVLGPLFAAGGDVNLNAGALQGNGTITAYGGPTITVTNNSPDYLVLSSITIPNEPGGQVNFTGAARSSPTSLHVVESGASARPVVDIQENYNAPVPSSNANGPSIFLTAAMDSTGNVALDPSGSIDNEAGQVAITVVDGSLIQAGSVNANQVNFTTQNGITALSNPNGLSSNAGTPSTDWSQVMLWPGGYDPFVDSPAPSDLESLYVAYVANAMYNSTGSITSDQTFTHDLLGFAGETPLSLTPGSTTNFQFPDTLAGREAATSLVFLGADAPWLNNGLNQDTDASASAQSPSGAFYKFSPSADDGKANDNSEGIFPVVPVEQVSPTTANSIPAITGLLTSGSTSVTAPSSVNGLRQGELVTGNGIAPGTTIQTVGSVSFLAGISSGSDVISYFGNTTLTVGESVSGPGIPVGTTILSVFNTSVFGGNVELSAPATMTVVGETLTASYLTLTKPVTITGSTSLSIGTASAINALGVFINAKYVDINEPINVGQSNNWSVSLPASLNSIIAQDKANYSNGIYSTTVGDAQGYYTLPAATISSGDSLIPAQYDAITNQIILSNVSASSGGFIVLDGEIISTNAFGEINVNSGAGQVNINNQTNYPIVVNNVAASASGTSSSLSGVDIIDRNPDVNMQSLYVYRPDNVIDLYVGSVSETQQQLEQGTPTEQTGNTSSYTPETGLRWEWQLQTTMQRLGLVPGNITTAGWSPDLTDVPGVNNPDNPWYYLNTQDGNAQQGTIQPTGWTIVDPTDENTEFLETMSGAVTDVLAPVGHAFDGAHGFATTNPPSKDPNGHEIDPWTFMYALEAELTLTSSVKADNPIGISFSSGTLAAINITSSQPVVLAGNIADPQGDTTISATSITQSSSASLTSNNLTFTATGGVGTSSQPLSASVTTGGVLSVQAGHEGVYLNLPSGALLGTISSGTVSNPGDVVLNASALATSGGSLDIAPGLPSGTVNITGNNLTLSSAGDIGTAAAPLAIQVYGVVNASALSDIGLNQQSGELEVGQIISTSGDVTIDPSDSPIVSASGTTWASEVDDAQSEQVWQDLSLTNPSDAIQQTITAFQNQVNATYAAYWQLIENGSVQNGVFVLNAQGLALYAGRAGLYLNITDPTDAQVQAFANSLYHNDVAFFNQNLAPNWASSADFQAYNPSFSYTATPQQQSDLSSNAAWTAPQLMNSVAQVAVDPAGGSPVGVLTPNISGRNVTLVATGGSGSIGQTGTSTFISAADLQSGNLTSAQRAALASASATRDVLMVGVEGGKTVTIPLGEQAADFTLTEIQIDPNQQLFISATGNLSLWAGSTITVQATSQDLALSQVTAGGTVNIAAQGSILASSSSTTITTPGTLILKVVTGTVGSPTVPLNVQQVGGAIYVYTLPGHAYLTGGATTSLAITASTAGSSTYGSSVTFTAKVSDSGAGIPTGTVAFYAGTTFLGQGTPLTGSGNSAISTLTTSTLAVGAYPSIIAVFTPTGHFAGSSDTLSFTVNPATLTITANNATKTYGQATSFAATAFTETGLVSGDSIVRVSESSDGAPMSATVGTYNIVPFAATGVGLGNYTINYVDGTLTVNPTLLTITANNDSKTYGTLKTFSGAAFTTTGLVTANGDTIAGVIETSTGSPLSATVGSYPIVPGAATGSGLSNYTIAYVNGTLTVNPALLTITANNDSKTYGTLKSFATTAFTQTGLVTANGDTIAGVIETSTGSPVSATVGSYPIVPSAATGSGLSNYTIAYVNGSLTVNPAILTITANNDSKTYGTLETFVSTAFTEIGLVTSNGDTIVGVTETSTGSPVSVTLGRYPVVPSAATGNGLTNYTINYANGTLTVNPALLTITANNDSKTYGTLKTFAATAFTESGLVTTNGDTISGVTETSTGSPVIAQVGTYPIVPSAATGNRLSNYIINYANGSLVINPASLTITANNDSKPFGTVKTFSPTAFTAVGLVTANGDTITGVTETSTGAPASAPVGTYPIVPSAATGNRLNNYTITYVNGTLTVNQSVIVLDPAAGGALSLSGNANITLAGGVFVDSSSSSALSVSGNATVKVSVISVRGGVQKSGTASLSPAPTTGAAMLPDPLASLAVPSTSGLTNYGSVSLSGGSSATIQPGIYSQINISGTGTLTMNSGVYIIEGGGFTVSGGAGVSGSGVTIFNAGSKYPSTGGTYGSYSLSGLGTYNLSPPTSGTFAGIVLFQPKDNTKALTLSGNGSGTSGEIYAPAAQLSASGNAVLNTTIVVDTMTISEDGVANTVALSASAGTVTYTPAQIRNAYGINALTLDGNGQTIAIVDAYDDPRIFPSLDAFDTHFGLSDPGTTLYDQYGPASSFLTVVNQAGNVAPRPSTDPSGTGTDNWEAEESLDVEWAHAVAPGARIVLVEADSAARSDLMTSVAAASHLPGVSVVSMSWGFPEGQAVFAADEQAYDPVFSFPGVTFLASTGDGGTADLEYPAFSPNVVAVGGTSLKLNADGSYASETGWGNGALSPATSIGSGGGVSAYELEPAYQQSVQSSGGRTAPDVSLVGDPATGAWVADTYNRSGSNAFQSMGGTSLSAPAWAGLIALVNQGRASTGESELDRAAAAETDQALYSLPRRDFHTITNTGNRSGSSAGYNFASGLGTPEANVLVPALIAYRSLGTKNSGDVSTPAAVDLVLDSVEYESTQQVWFGDLAFELLTSKKPRKDGFNS